MQVKRPITLIATTLIFALLSVSSVASAACTDSDAANNPAVLGSVEYNRTTYTDSCASSSSVVQYGCDRFGALVSSTSTCPTNQTCSAGVCSAPATCGGYDVAPGGTCVGGSFYIAPCSIVPPNTACITYTCNANVITETAVPPPIVDKCRDVSACDPKSGYTATLKPKPEPTDACYTVGSCDGTTGIFAQILKTPSSPAPTCTQYTGTCVNGTFPTTPIVCPTGQECSLSTGLCSPICSDNDPSNTQTLVGQLTIKGVPSPVWIDTCTSATTVSQVSCLANGTGTASTSTCANNFACQNGKCVDLCVGKSLEDSCNTYTCNSSTGVLTIASTKTHPDDANLCHEYSCNALTGFSYTNKTCPTGQSCYTPTGQCKNICSDNDPTNSESLVGQLTINGTPSPVWKDSCVSTTAISQVSCLADGTGTASTSTCANNFACQNDKCVDLCVGKSLEDSCNTYTCNSSTGVLTIASTKKAPSDTNLCHQYSCNATSGFSYTNKTCSAGQYCVSTTGECTNTCSDTDAANSETLLGQLSLKGVASGTDTCSGAQLVQKDCAADGTVKTNVAQTCTKGTCQSGVCVDLCIGKALEDSCNTYSCDSATGKLTAISSKNQPADANLCHQYTCNAATGFSYTDKTCAAGQYCVSTTGECTNACIDSDAANSETVVGQLTIKGALSPTFIDSCASTTALTQVVCAEDGTGTSSTAPCSNNFACKDGKCVDLCIGKVLEDSCNTYTCNSSTGILTPTQKQPKTAAPACTEYTGVCDNGTFLTKPLTCATGTVCQTSANNGAGGCIDLCFGKILSDKCNTYSCNPLNGDLTPTAKPVPDNPPPCMEYTGVCTNNEFITKPRVCPTDQVCQTDTNGVSACVDLCANAPKSDTCNTVSCNPADGKVTTTANKVPDNPPACMEYTGVCTNNEFITKPKVCPTDQVCKTDASGVSACVDLCANAPKSDTCSTVSCNPADGKITTVANAVPTNKLDCLEYTGECKDNAFTTRPITCSAGLGCITTAKGGSGQCENLCANAPKSDTCNTVSCNPADGKITTVANAVPTNKLDCLEYTGECKDNAFTTRPITCSAELGCITTAKGGSGQCENLCANAPKSDTCNTVSCNPTDGKVTTTANKVPDNPPACMEYTGVCTNNEFITKPKVCPTDQVCKTDTNGVSACVDLCANAPKSDTCNTVSCNPADGKVTTVANAVPTNKLDCLEYTGECKDNAFTTRPITCSAELGCITTAKGGSGQCENLCANAPKSDTCNTVSCNPTDGKVTTTANKVPDNPPACMEYTGVCTNNEFITKPKVCPTDQVCKTDTNGVSACVDLCANAPKSDTCNTVSCNPADGKITTVANAVPTNKLDCLEYTGECKDNAFTTRPITCSAGLGCITTAKGGSGQCENLCANAPKSDTCNTVSCNPATGRTSTVANAVPRNPPACMEYTGVCTNNEFITKPKVCPTDQVCQTDASGVSACVDLCAGKTLEDSCNTFTCNPLNGDLTPTQKKPTAAAPACAEYTGECKNGNFLTRPITCSGSTVCQTSANNGAGGCVDLCFGKILQDTCNTYSCNPLNGDLTPTPKPIPTTPPACMEYTGECKNNEFITKPRVCPTDQVCQTDTNGVSACVDLCGNAPKSDTCSTVSCNPADGKVTTVANAVPTNKLDCLEYTGECKDNAFTTRPITCSAELGCITTAKGGSGQCENLCANAPKSDTCNTVSCEPSTGKVTTAANLAPATPPACMEYTGECKNKEFVTRAKTCPTDRVCKTDASGASACVDLCASAPKSDTCNTVSCSPADGKITTVANAVPTNPPPCMEYTGICTNGTFLTTQKSCAANETCSTTTGKCTNKCDGYSAHSDKCFDYSCNQSTGLEVRTPVTKPTPGVCEIVSETCTLSDGYKITPLVCSANETCSTATGRCTPTDRCLRESAPSVDSCHTVSACNPTTGYAISSKAAPLPIDKCHIVSSCDPAKGGFSQVAKECPADRRCSTLTGECELIDKCAQWIAPIDWCNTHSCDKDTGKDISVPIAHPTDNRCKVVVGECDTAKGYSTITKTAPTQRDACQIVGDCNPSTGEFALSDVVCGANESCDTATGKCVAVADDRDVTKDVINDDTIPTDTPSECVLRSRRICGANLAVQSTDQNILQRSDTLLLDDLTKDQKTAITIDDPIVKETMTLVAKDPTTAQLTALHSQDTPHSRLSYCVRRVAKICANPDAYRLKDCSNERYAAEYPKQCSLLPVRPASCMGTNASVPSISTIFDVNNAKILTIPDVFKKLGTPLLLESDNPLQQYILLQVTDAANTADHEILVVDPKTGLSRVLGIEKGQDLHVVRDASGKGTSLMVIATDGIKYLPNASAMVAEKMTGAVPIGQLFTLPQTNLVDDVTEWKTVAIPTDEKIVSAQPNDTGVVAVTANADGTLKGVRYFTSLSDATNKLIPFPADAAGDTVRNAVFTPDAIDLSLVANNELIVMHADIKAETPTLTKLDDNAATTDALKMAMNKNAVKQSAGKTSTQNKPKDIDQFEGLLSAAVSSGTVGQPIVTHAFEDFGENSNALVVQDNGLGFVKTDNGAIKIKDGELLSLGANGSACGTIVDALPVDMDNSGGKDIALFIDNGGASSLVIYPNINQLQKFESVAAASTVGGIQLHQKSITEENETLKCHWEALQKMPNGTLVDVSSKLDKPDSCDPIFNPATAETTSALGIAAEWVVAQISISTAYADEAPVTTTADYVFRITTSDPLGLKAVAQVTAQIVTKTIQDADTPPEVKVVSVELLTPTQKEQIKTPASVGTSPGVGTQALTPITITEITGPAEGPAQLPNAFTTEGGCSLTHTNTTPSPLGWLWMLPLLIFIPSRVIYYRK